MTGRCRPTGYFLAACAAILLFTMLFASAISPAAGSYFKDQSFPAAYRYGLDTSPVLVDCTVPGPMVTELSRADRIVIVPGSTLNVSLMETDPHLNWLLADTDGALCLRNRLIETYPVRHVFTLKANDSCTVRFRLAEENTGKTMDAFAVDIAADPPVSGLGWPALSPDITPAFGWPPALKF